MFTVDEEKCMGCAACVNVCPVGAISINNDKAVIDDIKCNECGECLQVCPQNAIFNEVRSQNVPSRIPEQGVPNVGFGMGAGGGGGMGRENGRGAGRGMGRGLRRGPQDGRGLGRYGRGQRK